MTYIVLFYWDTNMQMVKFQKIVLEYGGVFKALKILNNSWVGLGFNPIYLPLGN
jgi:hypothetical protein